MARPSPARARSSSTNVDSTSLCKSARVRCGPAAAGRAVIKWSEGLQPDPPDLKKVAGQRQPSELFWVIKNGIKMTGMPGFGVSGVSDDEIWKIVAFVKKWPSVTAEDYKAWTASVAATPPG